MFNRSGKHTAYASDTLAVGDSFVSYYGPFWHPDSLCFTKYLNDSNCKIFQIKMYTRWGIEILRNTRPDFRYKDSMRLDPDSLREGNYFYWIKYQTWQAKPVNVSGGINYYK